MVNCPFSKDWVGLLHNRTQLSPPPPSNSLGFEQGKELFNEIGVWQDHLHTTFITVGVKKTSDTIHMGKEDKNNNSNNLGQLSTTQHTRGPVVQHSAYPKASRPTLSIPEGQLSNTPAYPRASCPTLQHTRGPVGDTATHSSVYLLSGLLALEWGPEGVKMTGGGGRHTPKFQPPE